MEGHWKFLGGRGVLKAKILEAKYEAKLEFPGGSMDISWNCTVQKFKSCGISNALDGTQDEALWDEGSVP